MQRASRRLRVMPLRQRAVRPVARWYFGTQANHPQNLYYQAMS
jgi:hypothetical protein